MKKIVMLQTGKGAPDNLHVKLYEKGLVYPNAQTELSDELYDIFVNQLGIAEDYVKPEAVAKHEKKKKFFGKKTDPPENKSMGNAPENKGDEPPTKLTAEDFKELGAGKVRQLAMKHGVDLKDKPFNTSAKLLVEVFLERQK